MADQPTEGGAGRIPPYADRMSDRDRANDLPDAEPSGEARPVDLRDYVRFSRDAAQRVRVLRTDQLALDLWCIEPQQATPVLRFEDTDVTYTVIGGRSWMVTEQGEIGLDPMGALLVPAGVTHAIDNRGADPLIVTASTAPPGEDPEDAPVADDAEAIRREDPDEPSTLRRLVRGLLGGERGEDGD